MKQLPQELIQEVLPTSEAKIAEIKEVINDHWDDFYTKAELARDVCNGYIFGKYATQEHFNIDEIEKYVDEVDLEKNPPPPEPEPTIIDRLLNIL